MLMLLGCSETLPFVAATPGVGNSVRPDPREGAISAGKLADYVVLAEDLRSISVEKIKDLKIVRTVVAGTSVYEG